MPFLNGIGPLEVVMILIIALIVVGPGKLPDVGAALGKSIREFRKAATDVKEATSLDAPAPVARPSAPAPAPVVAELPAEPPAPAPVAAPPVPAVPAVPAAPSGALAAAAAAESATNAAAEEAADAAEWPAEVTPVDEQQPTPSA